MIVSILKNEGANENVIYDFLTFKAQNRADYYAHVAVGALNESQRRDLQNKIVRALNNAR